MQDLRSIKKVTFQLNYIIVKFHIYTEILLVYLAKETNCQQQLERNYTETN